MNICIHPKLSFKPTETQLEQLQMYVNLLLKWNNAINLIGKSTQADIWDRHIWDCAQLIPYIQTQSVKQKSQKNLEVLDFGSGAGLPAVVLAILMPQAHITACEKVGKKCDFIKTVKIELGLQNLMVENKPVQSLLDTNKQYNIITARAVSELEALLKWTEGLLTPKGQYIFLKGSTASREISTAQDNFLDNYPMTLKRFPSIVNSSGEVLIFIKK